MTINFDRALISSLWSIVNTLWRIYFIKVRLSLVFICVTNLSQVF